MFIGWQTYWILLTNQTQNNLHIIKQCGWSDVLQVCIQLQIGSCKLLFIQVENVVITNSGTYLSFLRSLICRSFCFDFHATRRQKKKLCRRLLPPYHSSFSLQIWLLLHETKTNPLHWYGIASKIWTSLTYEDAITLIIKTDHCFVQLRFLKVV